MITQDLQHKFLHQWFLCLQTDLSHLSDLSVFIQAESELFGGLCVQ